MTLHLADVTEEELLARIVPLLQGPDARVLVGPGDDTAWLTAGDGRYLATTDAMVRGHDWIDEWSTGEDVGHKTVAQNLADIAAMGGVPTGLLLTLAADPRTPVSWCEDLARGIGCAARAAGTSAVGGDLSGADAGTVMVSVTAFGSMEGRRPVLRSGARVGDVVAVAGTLGRSAAGWALLREERGAVAPDLVQAHLRPAPPLAQGPAAARHGAHAMIDLSDGLVRDAGRIARASGVVLALTTDLLHDDVAALAAVVGEEAALDCILTGGEEHSLLATFADEESLPQGWRVIGRVEDAGDTRGGMLVDGTPRSGGGWDHFDASR
ncbi:thiamine-phosphate kinase [Mobilicoccus pelagius]|uniref:Thiamine-monophosphate kinase n=1 Tax=Mobilicoccus pelagius NBRC 104925 TaxID=1089455 RepID=H5UNF5_9MICO|nr:thiamine-phosphate kinase [Mobilicoccus pelagius]GAB47263.1 thiamine monophosphate kinase [Mobilicoccus pelagius NBRC 104925]